MPKENNQITYQIEDFQKLNATKDYIFKEVVCESEVIQELVCVVLNNSDIKITACEAEANYCAGLGAHNIYCDVVGEKDDLGLVDLEMQVRIKKDLIERAQFYASLLLVNGDRKLDKELGKLVESKEDKKAEMAKERAFDYGKIPTSYSIWFTVGDVFKNEKPVNVIEYCLVSDDREITSKATIIFYNICMWEDMEGEMSDICHFLLESTKKVYSQSNSRVVKLLYSRLEELKKSQVKEKDYMKHEREIVEAVQDAVEDVVEEMTIKHEREKAEAVQDAVEDVVEEMTIKHEHEIEEMQIGMIMGMVDAKLPIPQIASIVKVSTDEIQRIIEEHAIA